jgi:hypothetical protein
VLPFGVLALGYAADAPTSSAAKPDLADVCFDGAWGRALGSAGGEPVTGGPVTGGPRA